MSKHSTFFGEKLVYSAEASYSTKNPADSKKKLKLKPIFLSLTSAQLVLSKIKNKVFHSRILGTHLTVRMMSSNNIISWN
jgi:hypothetical protein